MRFTLIIAVLLVLPAATAAQSRDLAALRDSLSNDTSVTALRQRENALARAKDQASLMERGLVLLRLFEINGKKNDADDAREIFEKLADRSPNDPWIHYAYGLALGGGPHLRVPSPFGVLDGFVLGQSIAEVVGQDPRSRAARQFLKALELDPNLAPAALELTELVLSTRNKDALKKTRDALMKIPERTSAVTVALTRIQSALGDVAGAESTAAALANDASPMGLRARAEALLRQPGKAEAGAKAYFQGIEKLDEAAAAAYFEDVRIVATERELQTWEQGDLNAKRAWLRSFWDVRAAASGITVGERIAEHYTRLADAQSRFRRVGKRGSTPGGVLLQKKFDAEQLPFDERGLMYVRHGEPEKVLRTTSIDLRPNESWVYTLPSGKKQLYHFVVTRDGTDFRLTDDLLNAIDASYDGLPYEAISKLFEDRVPYDARYNILATRINAVRNQAWASAATLFGIGTSGPFSENAQAILGLIGETRQRLAMENREAAFAALASDTDRPDFDEELPFYFDVFGFRGRDRKTDVTAAIAIPGTSLEPKPTDAGLLYSVQVSFILIDTVKGGVTRKDTTYTYLSSHTLRKDEYLRLHATLASAATQSAMHRVVVRDAHQPDKGQLYGGSVPINSYDTPKLTISDIVLAEPEPGTWKRREAQLAFVPPRQFVEGEPVNLFYEIYNLPRGADYRTEISLEPAEGGAATGFTRLKRLFGGSDGRVNLSFTGVANADPELGVQEVRRMSSGVKSGKYQLIVRITNLATGETAQRAIQYVVLKKK